MTMLIFFVVWVWLLYCRVSVVVVLSCEQILESLWGVLLKLPFVLRDSQPWVMRLSGTSETKGNRSKVKWKGGKVAEKKNVCRNEW